VRVIVPDVGGAFGCKIDIYPEEMIASFASMKLGRSVKWSEDRSENLAVTVQRTLSCREQKGCASLLI